MRPLPPPLDALPEDEAELLDRYLTPAKHEPDALIVSAGDAGDGCLFIDEGLVRLEVPQDHLDNDVTLGYLEAGEILGELSLLDAQPRSVSAFADTSVAGRWLSLEGFNALVHEHPHVGVDVLAALGRDAARKLRVTNQRLADFLTQDAVDPEVEDLVGRARAARAALMASRPADELEKAVDAMLDDLADAFAAAGAHLAEETVTRTRLGNVRDKTLKNVFAARGVRRWLGREPGGGQLGEESNGVTQLADAAGVVFALIPVTNPVATAYFKVLSSLKTRNAIILSFHRICLPLAEQVGAIAHEVLERHGFPADLVLWVRQRASRQKTALFMSHPGVDLILATGGPGMVKAAYQSGTPAIGVGAGNGPCWIAPDAELEDAAGAVVWSKSFDNGLICGAEQNLVVERAVLERFVEELEDAGAAVLDAEEAERVLEAIVNPRTGHLQGLVLGQSAQTIADFLGVKRDHPIEVIAIPGVPDLDSALAQEKMAPLVSLFTVDGDDEAIALCRRLLETMGTGHTAMVHTASDERVRRFADAMPASRILVNSPGSQGVCGLTTGLPPSLTLGCGTYGRTSTSENVTFTNLRNVKRIARYVEPDFSLLEA